MAETPTKKPWVIEEHDQRRLYVGSLCAQWSHLEYVFARSIWSLLKIDRETGIIVTGGLDILPRANMAITLARHLKASQTAIKALVAARKEIQDKLIVPRNLAVHGVQFVSGNTVMVEVHRGKGDRKRKELKLRDLIDLCEAVFQASDKLQSVVEPIIWGARYVPPVRRKPASSP